jgi:diadenosine tetraphosphatase ApaH/serine/threonine PP2A family protein phosphatase
VRDLSRDGGDVPERVTEYRRIAVFGGVYANAEALAAVLADARRRDAEAVFCLGDLGGFGPHPERIVPMLREAGVGVVRGNYDDAVAAGAADCNCGYTDPRDNHYARLAYAYTVARTPSEHRAWLSALPGTRRARLGPHRVLMCHGSPRRINEFLWESTTPDGLLRRLLADHAADVLLCTHTGITWRRALAGGAAHAANVGAIGRPQNDGTPDVWYAMLTAEPEVAVEFVRVAYDHEAVARAIEAEGLPAEFAATLRTGWWTTCLENLPARERARGRF